MMIVQSCVFLLWYRHLCWHNIMICLHDWHIGAIIAMDRPFWISSPRVVLIVSCYPLFSFIKHTRPTTTEKGPLWLYGWRVLCRFYALCQLDVALAESRSKGVDHLIWLTVLHGCPLSTVLHGCLSSPLWPFIHRFCPTILDSRRIPLTVPVCATWLQQCVDPALHSFHSSGWTWPMVGGLIL